MLQPPAPAGMSGRHRGQRRRACIRQSKQPVALFFLSFATALCPRTRFAHQRATMMMMMTMMRQHRSALDRGRMLRFSWISLLVLAAVCCSSPCRGCSRSARTTPPTNSNISTAIKTRGTTNLHHEFCCKIRELSKCIVEYRTLFGGRGMNKIDSAFVQNKVVGGGWQLDTDQALQDGCRQIV